MNENRILLEAGTNELEIVVVEIAGIAFGINVAKVREVILPTRVHELPDAPGCIEGVIELRGKVVELLDLKDYMGLGPFSDEERMSDIGSQILVTELNEFEMAFRVASVRKIERASWRQIIPIPSTLKSSKLPIVGIAQLGDEMVQMVDLETIIAEFKPELALTSNELPLNVARRLRRIVIAEDSDLIRDRAVSVLKSAGYESIHAFSNGADAWSYIEPCDRDNGPELVVTDIEMPQLDGLHLCKRIRDHRLLGQIPVILFSSLINERTLNKGDQVGATMQITKPQLDKVVAFADKLLGIQSEVADSVALGDAAL